MAGKIIQKDTLCKDGSKHHHSSQKINWHITRDPFTPRAFPLDSTITKLLYTATWVLYSVYISQAFIISWEKSTSASSGLWYVWITFAIVFFTILPDFISTWEKFLYIGRGKEYREPPQLSLIGNTAPAIDIFITCCGEDVDVILDTAAAAASLDYPDYRVFLLDDAKSVKVQRAIQTFNDTKGPDQREITYLSRDKVPGVPHYFKSGNIRFGLDTTANSGQYAEFVAGLDVNMIPERDWLRRLIPHLLLDKSVAMVVPPQRFYNTPAGDPLAQDSNVFALVGEPVNDSLGATSCTGSGYILRRSALEDIGGWPLAEAGEDILCSHLLTGHGWKIKFIPVDVQFGLVPGSLTCWFEQRARWTEGNLVVYRKLGWFLPGWDLTPLRDLPQRVAGIAHVCKTFAAIPYSILFLILPWGLYPVTDSATPTSSATNQRYWLQRLLLAAVILNKLSSYRIFQDIGTKTAGRHRANRIWSAPMNAMCIIRSWIPNHKIGFAVTGTIVSTLNERSPHNRKPLLSRFLHPSIMGYILWFLYALIPVALRVHYRMRDATMPLIPPNPLVLSSFFATAMVLSIPLKYMTNPPSTPERRELLERDSNGLYRAGAQAKARSSPENGIGWKDLTEIALILWAHKLS